MKTQRVNPNGMNPMQMNKRKITVNLDKNNKKFLSKFIEEVKKQFSSSAMGAQVSGLGEFFDYIKSVADAKEQMELKLSFEEYEFLKRMIVDSIRGMEGMTFKWYQFIKKGMLKVMIKQYRELLTKFK